MYQPETRSIRSERGDYILRSMPSEISDPVLFSLPFRSRIAFFSVLQSDRLGHHVIVADLFTKVELGGPDDGESHPFVKSDGPGRLLPDLQPD